MMAARRFRIEVYRGWPGGGFRVVCCPVEYLGRDEFKTWIRTCRRHFMSLASKRPCWAMERSFTDESEARRFASQLAYDLGEPIFLCLGTVTPCKLPEASV
jgi:hypothetical protein